MDNAKPFPDDVLQIGAPPATERCFETPRTSAPISCSWFAAAAGFGRWLLSQQNHRADGDGGLAALLDPSLATPERAVARVDGWTLGVA